MLNSDSRTLSEVGRVSDPDGAAMAAAPEAPAYDPHGLPCPAPARVPACAARRPALYGDLPPLLNGFPSGAFPGGLLLPPRQSPRAGFAVPGRASRAFQVALEPGTRPRLSAREAPISGPATRTFPVALN